MNRRGRFYPQNPTRLLYATGHLRQASVIPLALKRKANANEVGNDGVDRAQLGHLDWGRGREVMCYQQAPFCRSKKRESDIKGKENKPVACSKGLFACERPCGRVGIRKRLIEAAVEDALVAFCGKRRNPAFDRVHPVFGHGSEESSSIVPFIPRVKAYYTGLTIIKRFCQDMGECPGLGKTSRRRDRAT